MECLRNVQNVGELEEDLVKASLHHRTVDQEFASEGLKRRQPEINKILFLEIFSPIFKWWSKNWTNKACLWSNILGI